ncbi:fimbrial biogenesis outer membrane usher protein [Aeromonas salmonicida]|uniref:fimbria/pilus outer membrane usher protein n=1 Tax=Aeromonas salmonicida TaxID=645 RepID=UPI00259D4BA4|nr:fimbria/pilus outer membrane usher protein [Aeromonas salmonicida]MDM5065435.1 fimbrial biogenesis outer membrane usher protein [Aeromonas salmonicida]
MFSKNKKRVTSFIYWSVMTCWVNTENVLASSVSDAGQPKYNSAFLRGANGEDLERFLNQGGVVPGRYRVELYVNSQLVAMENIEFMSVLDVVQPCITVELMQRMGVKRERYVVAAGALSCVNLEEIEHANWDYDSSTQKLKLSFPQTALQYNSRSYVDPALWDEGVTAAFVNYNLQSRFNNSDTMGATRSHYLGLNSGVNIGLWRLRNQSVLNGIDDHGYWQSQRTYIERDLTEWRSQLSAGQVYSRSDVFNSPALLGFQVRSDDAMLPDELRGYSPVVGGVADTNATVEIRQGGNLIYSATVAPGPFEFRDIPTYGSNGDLEITVIEADGTRKVRTQGFGMLPVMVRKGTSRYQLSLGQLDNDLLDARDQWYFSADGAYGVLSDLTLYGGVQGMQYYYALNAGLGIGSRFGSLSFDVTQSDSDTRMGHYQGQSYRFRFGRVFHDAGTTLALAGYRYATEDYRSLDDHIRDYSKVGGVPHNSRIRSNMSVSVNQRMPINWGGLNLSASEQDYWDNRAKSRSLSASYGHYLGRLNYQLGVQKTSSDWGDDTLFSLYASHPLSWSKGHHRVSLGSNWQKRSNDNSNYQNLGISGSWEDYSYNLSASRDSLGNQRLAASTNLRAAFGEGGVGYSSGNGYQSASAHLSGSLIAHSGGLNAAPSFYDGAILVEVPEQEGVGFRGSRAKTGTNGFAVLETNVPYRRNELSVDSRTLADGVELADGNALVVPRRGAITHAKIAARKVSRVQFTLLDSSGQPYPFGTQLESVDGTLLAIADPHGRVLALLEKSEGELVIVGRADRCYVPFIVNDNAKSHFTSAILQCGA